MRGGDFAGGTLQVLLEAKVEGLADGADDVLGQTIGALQDVTRWQGFKKNKKNFDEQAAVETLYESRHYRKGQLPLLFTGSFAT